MVALPNEADFMHVWTLGSAAALAAARSRKNDAASAAGRRKACGDPPRAVNVPAAFDRSAIVQPDAFVDPELRIVVPSSVGPEGAATPVVPAARTRIANARSLIGIANGKPAPVVPYMVVFRTERPSTVVIVGSSSAGML
jgi:hypothetical protein